MTYGLQRLRRKHRLGLWATVLAFLLQTLAWSAMPVYAQNADDGWMVICTSDGPQRISLNELGILDGPLKNAPLPTLVDHCDLCVFAKGLGMVPTPVQMLASHRCVPALRVHVPDDAVSDKPHSPQQPRAPPAHTPI